MSERLIRIPIRDLATGSVLKLVFLINLAAWSVAFFLLAVTSLAGVDVVRTSQGPVHGLQGVIVALIFCLLFIAFGMALTLIGWGLLSLAGRVVGLGSISVISAAHRAGDSDEPGSAETGGDGRGG